MVTTRRESDGRSVSGDGEPESRRLPGLSVGAMGGLSALVTPGAGKLPMAPDVAQLLLSGWNVAISWAGSRLRWCGRMERGIVPLGAARS